MIKYAAVIGLLTGMLVYSCIQIINLRIERQRDWDKSSRTYMMIQAAYQEGLTDGRKGVINEE